MCNLCVMGVIRIRRFPSNSQVRESGIHSTVADVSVALDHGGGLVTADLADGFNGHARLHQSGNGSVSHGVRREGLGRQASGFDHSSKLQLHIETTPELSACGEDKPVRIGKRNALLKQGGLHVFGSEDVTR